MICIDYTAACGISSRATPDASFTANIVDFELEVLLVVGPGVRVSIDYTATCGISSLATPDVRFTANIVDFEQEVLLVVGPWVKTPLSILRLWDFGNGIALAVVRIPSNVL